MVTVDSIALICGNVHLLRTKVTTDDVYTSNLLMYGASNS